MGPHQGFHLCLSAEPAAEWSGPTAASSAAQYCSVYLHKYTHLHQLQREGHRQVEDQWRCAYRASRGSAAGSTAGEGMLQCGSGSSWSAQTSGWHSWSQHGPGGTQLMGVHISSETRYPEYRMKEDEAINETHNIKPFGHEKLVFIPQHLKEVQMPENTSNKRRLVTAADRSDPPAAPMGGTPLLQYINSSFYIYLSRVAFSCACSLSMIGWMPNIRNS